MLKDLDFVEIDLSKFNTSLVTNMSRMFSGCRYLSKLDLSSFDTSNVTNMSSMFYDNSLKSLDLSSFNTSNVTDMSSMFERCYKLTSLDLSSFDTSNVTSMYSMFNGCSLLTSIYVKPDTDWSTSSSLANSNYMFTGCKNLIGGNGTVFNTDKTDKTYACVDGLNGKIGYFTDLNTVLRGSLINTILLSFSSATRFKPSKEAPPSSANRKTISHSPGKDKVYLYQDGDVLYYYAKGFTDSGVGIPLHQNSSAMFQNTGFIEIDLSGFDTSKVTNMRYMFNGCSSLTSIDLSSFNTSNVTSMSYMFNGCSSLTNIDLSSFDTSNVTYMSGMFYKCSELTNLDLSSFDTSKVTSTGSMFYGCGSLTSLDLSSFDTSNVTYMSNMFYDCSSLTSLDLSSFDTSKVTEMRYMFYDCSSLTTIGVKPNTDWSTSSILTYSSGMFGGSRKLLGGNGTVFNTNKTDKTYARVDGLDGKPGYFTAK